MLTKIKKLTLTVLLVALLGGRALAATTTAASLSVSGGNYEPDANFSVPIYENSGAADINVVLLVIQFDPSKLQATGVEPSSTMADAVKPQISGGTITITRFPNAPPFKTSGQIQVATIDFKALPGVGNAAVSTANGSRILAGRDDLWDGVVSAATLNFVTPASPPSSSPTGSTPTPAPTAPKTTPITRQKTTHPQTDPLTKAWVARNYVINSQNTESGPLRLVINFLVACVMAAAAFTAMYFDVHTRAAKKSKHLSKKAAARVAHRKMVMTAKRQVRRA